MSAKKMPQKWLLGICGGIAAYKAPELVRMLKGQLGANVKVILSPNAKEFVTPITLQAVTGSAPYESDADPRCNHGMAHIELAKWAEGIIIAPLSANRLAALANGFADDLLTATCLATTAPIWIAPAMNQQMWLSTVVQENISMLRQRGIRILGPASGEQACGDIGPGRMLEPEAIVDSLAPQKPLLAGKTVLITAGPTHEPIDPVRFIGNHSSGKMGFALAEAASSMGANVRIIAGPVSLPAPVGCKLTRVNTALQMFDAVMTQVRDSDIFISAAAVADFRVKAAKQKMKKQALLTGEGLVLEPNPDILHEVCSLNERPFCVGFAAETEHAEKYAQQKREAKGCELIVLNDVSRDDIGFGSDQNAVTVFSATQKWHIPKQDKADCAVTLLEIISEQLNAKNSA